MTSRLSRIANVAMTVVMVTLLVTFIAWLAVPRAMGLTPQRVLTGSMEPKLPVGSVALVHAIQAQDVKIGDIITFQEPIAGAHGTLITHRVVGLLADSSGAPAFRTRGDANGAEDPWVVPATLLVGEVRFVVPFVGRWTNKVQSPLGMLIIIVLPALYLATGELRSVVREVQAHRRGIHVEAETP